MIGRNDVEAFRQCIEKDRPVRKPIGAMQVDQRHALAATGQAELAAVNVDRLPGKFHDQSAVPVRGDAPSWLKWFLAPCISRSAFPSQPRGARRVVKPRAQFIRILCGSSPAQWGQRRDGTLQPCAVLLRAGFPRRCVAGARGRRINHYLFTTATHGGLQMADLSVNGRTHRVDVDPDTPLLWVLRDAIGLTGTKYGCGIAQCGACTVHVDGIAMRSCSVPLSAVEGRQITTIEGLAQNGVLHKVQQAWLDQDVTQCGYYQCGQIMTDGQRC